MITPGLRRPSIVSLSQPAVQRNRARTATAPNCQALAQPRRAVVPTLAVLRKTGERTFESPGSSQLIYIRPDIVKLPIVKYQPALIRTRRNIDITVLPANLVMRIGSPRVELLQGIVIETADC